MDSFGSHILLAFSVLYFASTFNFHGGDRIKVELVSYEATKSNKKIRKILTKGGVTSYIKKLHGFDSQISQAFLNGWQNRVLRVYEMEVNII